MPLLFRILTMFESDVTLPKQAFAENENSYLPLACPSTALDLIAHLEFTGCTFLYSTISVG